MKKVEKGTKSKKKIGERVKKIWKTDELYGAAAGGGKLDRLYALADAALMAKMTTWKEAQTKPTNAYWKVKV